MDTDNETIPVPHTIAGGQVIMR